MVYRPLSIHRRNRNLVMGLGWGLFLAGYFVPSAWLLAAAIFIWNGYACYLMARDKRLARSKGFRIPEASLLWTAALGGGGGALAGMLLWRHKTHHASFLLLVPLFCILQVFLLICYWPGR